MDIPENMVNEILENNPSQDTVYIILSRLKDEGEYRRVIGECHNFLSRYPDNLRLRKLLAEAYFEDGRLLEAESELVKVIDGIRDLGTSFRILAEIYHRQKRYDSAADCLRLFLDHFPGENEAISLLERLKADMEEASIGSPAEREEFEEIPETEFPEDEFPEIITGTLAETYIDQGKLEEAAEIYEKLLEKDPQDKAFEKRLEEIRSMISHSLKDESGIEVSMDSKKERVINVLDTWLNSLREDMNKELQTP